MQQQLSTVWQLCRRIQMATARLRQRLPSPCVVETSSGTCFTAPNKQVVGAACGCCYRQRRALGVVTCAWSPGITALRSLLTYPVTLLMWGK